MATEDGHVWHTIRFANGTWAPVGDVTEQLHYFGPVTAVAAASTATGEAQFLLATADGGLWHTIRFLDGSWEPLGRTLVESWDPTGYVTRYIRNPGRVVALAAASAASGDAQFLMATDDGRLWHTVRSGQQWTYREDVNAKIGDPGRVVALAAASAIPGEAQEYLMASDDGRLWHTIRHANGTWEPMGDVNSQIAGHPVVVADPGAPRNNPGAVDVLGLGRAVAVTAASTTPGEVQFLFATDDGHLWHTIRSADGSWALAGDVNGQIGEPGHAAAVAATSVTPGEVQYFFCVR